MSWIKDFLIGGFNMNKENEDVDVDELIDQYLREDKVKEQLFEPGYTYKNFTCPYCGESSWLEHIGEVFSVIHEDGSGFEKEDLVYRGDNVIEEIDWVRDKTKKSEKIAKVNEEEDEEDDDSKEDIVNTVLGELRGRIQTKVDCELMDDLREEVSELVEEEMNKDKNTASKIDHISQELTAVRKSILNNVDLERDSKEELRTALEKTIGSLSELEEESRELQREMVIDEEMDKG